MRERGNILFLILLAVILFAALSYAVTASMRGGGKDVSDETAEAGASALLNYLSLAQTEIQRLMLTNGCTIDNLDWRNGIYSRYDNVLIYNTPPNTPKTGCAVFQGQGGPLTPATFEKYASPNHEPNVATNVMRAGHFVPGWVMKIDQGTPRSEIALYTDGISPKVCLAIAKKIDPTLTALTSDAHTFTNRPHVAEPAYSSAANVIGNVPQNVNSEPLYFSMNTTYNYCQLGMVIIPQ